MSKKKAGVAKKDQQVEETPAVMPLLAPLPWYARFHKARNPSRGSDRVYVPGPRRVAAKVDDADDDANEEGDLE